MSMIGWGNRSPTRLDLPRISSCSSSLSRSNTQRSIGSNPWGLLSRCTRSCNRHHLEPISVGRDHKVQQPMEQVEKLRTRRFHGLVDADESHRARRKLETDRCHVDQDGAAAAQASGTSTRMSPSTGARPQRHGGDPLCAADRLPVECVGRHWDLFVRLGISQVSRVARLWCLPRVLAAGTTGLR